MAKYLTSHPYLTLIVVCGLLFFLHLRVFPVKIMEARNFSTAREMVVDGSWLLTTLNGEPRYEKPPLPAWMSALSAAVFGVNNIAAQRLPISLMALFTALFFYQLVFLFTHKKEFSLLASLILITSFYYLAIQREAPVDMYAQGFMVASLFFLVKLIREENKTYSNAVLAAMFFGLSFLSKGPISLYAMLIPFLLSLAITFGRQTLRHKLLPFLVLVIVAVLVSSWWFILVRLADPDTFAKIIGKETANWSSYNLRPFYYYWSFFSQSGLWTLPALAGLLYPLIKNHVADNKVYRFAWWWTILAVILLSLIPEKKPRYLLPVLFPMAITTAAYIDFLFRNFKNQKFKFVRVPGYVHFGLITVAALVTPVGLYFFLKNALPDFYLWFALSGILSISIGIYLVRNLIRRNAENLFYGSILFYIALFVFGFPLVRSVYDNTNLIAFKALMEETQKNNIPVYAYSKIAPEIVWVAGRTLPLIDADEQSFTPPARAFGVLTETDMESSLVKTFGSSYTVSPAVTVDLTRTYEQKKKVGKNYFVYKYYILTKKTASAIDPSTP